MSEPASTFPRLAVALADGDEALLCYLPLAARLAGATEVHLLHLAPASRARAPELAAGVHVEEHAIAPPLIDGILRFARERAVDVVLVGESLGRRRRVLGRRLAMAAPCSVWLVPAAREGFRRVLVPVDFSEHARDSLRTALSLAARAGADCLLLHVFFDTAVVSYEEHEQVERGEEERAFAAFLRGVETSVRIETLAVEAPHVWKAVGELADERGADLVVMGTRGRSRSAAILLGSETEHALAETHVPLLAVKHFGARLGLVRAVLDPRVRRQPGPRFG
jgi:nucleotide-binding universal stress UspA family protein